MSRDPEAGTTTQLARHRDSMAPAPGRRGPGQRQQARADGVNVGRGQTAPEPASGREQARQETGENQAHLSQAMVQCQTQSALGYFYISSVPCQHGGQFHVSRDLKTEPTW